MNKEILSFFNQELGYLREAGTEFAKLHPKEAGNLKLSAQGSKDPQVALLMESFAFLAARIQEKLNDDFPEITETLLNILCPHYLAPIPAMGVIQFAPMIDLKDHFTIPAGTQIETDPTLGEVCHFRTCYETMLLPVKVVSAKLMDHLQRAPALSAKDQPAGCLHLTLRCLDEDMQFAKLAPEKIRFFLGGHSQHALALYEMLCKNILSVSVATHYQDNCVQFLSPNSIQPAGFEASEGVLPYPAQSLLAYRLLTEFFIFPEKFLFIDFITKGIDFSRFGNQLEVYIYLNQVDKTLIRYVTQHNFLLGCTPIVNLFKHVAEPMTLNQKEYQHRVTPDSRHPDALEIYSIDKVMGILESGEEVEYLPFNGMKYGVHHLSHSAFWTSSRKTAANNPGCSDVYISTVNLDNEHPSNHSLYLETTCMNRLIPERFMYESNINLLQLSSFAAPVTHVSLVVPLTPAHPPLVRQEHYIALMSHLNFNYGMFIESDQGIHHLKEMLRLYSFNDKEETRLMIDSLSSIRTKRINRRVTQGLRVAFCQGLHIGLEIDETKFSSGTIYLFARVLEKFLALYCSINTFIELEVTSKIAQHKIYQGQPCTGVQTTL